MHQFDPSKLFPVIDRHIWLNHAAISAWPTPVIEAAHSFVQENQLHGALNYETWVNTEEHLRTQLAQFIHAPSANDISLLRNTSEALNIIAQGLSWQSGDEVIFPANEFPSNLLPWAWLQNKGVVPKAIELSDKNPEQDLIDAMTPKTRLVAASSVQFDTGLRLDLARIGQACRRHDALFSVDVIQHLGAIPLDLSTLPIDFVVCGSHKWLMAPEGIGFMWSRASARAQMEVALPGWRMYPDPFNFNRTDWTPPDTGRRFETGTVNMFGIHGLAAAISLLAELGPTSTSEALLDRTDYLVSALSQNPHIEMITPIEREKRAGIVCFRPKGTNAECMVDALAKEQIFVAKRGHNIRVSPHFYTPYDQIDAFLNRIEDARLWQHCAA
ncbi:MAG TPA: aminotransferase class V-fold PLP-dependent enzyme [Wenzhouxiangella sp.]